MKPATPLPWQLDDDTHILDMSGDSILAPTQDGELRGECYEAQDAAFIVHACNNYGPLVERLKLFRMMASEHGPDNPWGLADSPKSFLENIANGTESILRELGEIE